MAVYVLGTIKPKNGKSPVAEAQDISLPGGQRLDKVVDGLLDRVAALEKKSRTVDVELPVANWVGDTHPYSQIVAIDGITANSQVDLTPNVEQLVTFYDYSEDVSLVAENNAGVVTVYAIGQKPEHDYIIQATVTEVATT